MGACFFFNGILILTDSVNKVITKLKNVIKPFEMTLNSKCRIQKIKNKNQKNRNMKKQNTERRKPTLTKRIGRKCRLIKTRTEQNNDHTQIIHKIQFRSSFNLLIKPFFYTTKTSRHCN